MPAMYIRDPIFGDININDTAQCLIDNEWMQRLRYIKQLGFDYLVYPAANHSRFEHSLGTMKVTSDMASKIFHVDDPELSIAGLMHDIGHTPFSHQSEEIATKYLHKTHEEMGADLISQSSIRDVISESTLSLKKILSYFKGKGKGKLITGPLGSDRIDYLMRDAYHTGVAYGVIDYIRLMNKLAFFRGGNVAIYENGIGGAESMLIARYYMFSSVYLHHAALIAGEMYIMALENAIDEGSIMPKELVSFTDDKTILELLKSNASKHIIEMVLSRNLFKRTYYGEIGKKQIKIQEVRDAIESKGVNHNDYIISVINFKGGNDDTPLIDNKGKYIGMLSEKSELFNTLGKILNNRRILMVACIPRFRGKISTAIKKVL